MSQELHDYIREAKEKGAAHHDIKESLVGAGWHPHVVDEAMRKHSEPTYPVPTPPAAPSLTSEPVSTFGPQTPVPVVYNYTARGVEYFLMLITLAVSAVSLGALLHSIVGAMFNDGGTNIFVDGIMSFAGSALIVCLPLFIFFFLRLKSAEMTSPRLRHDPSRRRAFQIAIFSSFTIGVFSLIGYVYTIFNTSDLYGGGESVGLTIADMIITLGIVGGIFAYFWLDNQREGRQ